MKVLTLKWITNLTQVSSVLYLLVCECCALECALWIYTICVSMSQSRFRGSDGKESACNAGHPGLIPGLGRSPGDGNGNPLQYFCLENSMDGRAYSPLGHKRVGHSWVTNTPPRVWIFYNRTFEQNLSKAFEQRQLISITVNLSRLTTGSAVEDDTHQIPWCAGVPVLSLESW